MQGFTFYGYVKHWLLKIVRLAKNPGMVAPERQDMSYIPSNIPTS
jgi:hypothetical protein